ncbi:hypothetical protein FXO37_19257 [Capsicum annuum]|nr:hypothetical protein FXO37_19257 [Capsicum annuum]
MLQMQRLGYKNSDCPNRRVIVLHEGEPYYEDEVGQEEEHEQDDHDFEVDEEDHDPYEGEVTVPNGLMMRVPAEKVLSQEGELTVPNYVVRRVMISKVMDDPSQKENLIHSKCLIKENVCSLIIDSGSCANVASTTLVEFLKLPTTKHATPYKLQWLSECGELRVHRQVLIKFKIGNYRDEILCDVVPIKTLAI